MSMISTSKNVLLAAVVLTGSLVLHQGDANARTIPAIMGAFNTSEINGVKLEDCISYLQHGSVMNVCKHTMEYLIPLPIDTAGKKSVRVTAAPFRDNILVSPPPVVPIECLLLSRDEGGAGLVITRGVTTNQPTMQSFTINSQPVPEGGRLHLVCRLPYRATLATVNYTP